MTNSLSIYQQFDQIQGAALAMHRSGFFKDVASEAQAIVKVMAGAELGIPPFAAMTGISIIQGKPTLGANLMASLVKNDPRYDYRVKQCDNEACVLEWFEHGTKTGESAFTIDEAKAAGLAGKDNWKKYTSDMLFARAISRGTRRFAPGVFGGSPVYTPDELGADTDPDGYIDAQVVEVVAPEVVTNSNGNERPLSAEVLKNYLIQKSEKYAGSGKSATDKQRKLLPIILSECFADERERHAVTEYIFNVASTSKLTDYEVLATLDWLGLEKGENGKYVPSEHALAEIKNLINATMKEQGQQELAL